MKDNIYFKRQHCLLKYVLLKILSYFYLQYFNSEVYRPGPSLLFKQRSLSLNLVTSALWITLWQRPGPIRKERPGLNVPNWSNRTECP